MQNTAQLNMVEQQIRPWNVNSAPLLDAIARLNRSLFVPAEQQSLCYADTAIALGRRSDMLEPKIVARMIQALALQSDDRVLVVGAGSGYTAALCASLAYTVDVIDTQQTALDRAAQACAAARCDNISFTLIKDASSAHTDAEYDAILLREACQKTPTPILIQLATGGRGVALVGKQCIQEMMRYTKQGTSIIGESLFDRMVPSRDAVPIQTFTF